MTTNEVLGIGESPKSAVENYVRQIELLKARQAEAEAEIYRELQVKLQAVADVITGAQKIGLELDLTRPEFFQPLSESGLNAGDGYVSSRAPHRVRRAYGARGDSKERLKAFIETWPVGTVIYRQELLTKYKDQGIMWLINRYLPDMEKDGIIERVQQGQYKRLK